jgi:AraC family transcriptional regulator
MTERYAGRVRETLTRSGLGLVEATYREGLEVDPHEHDRPLLVVVLSGVQEEEVGGRSVDCRAGTALFHPRGEPHANCFGDRGARCLIVELRRGWIRRMGPDQDLLPDRPAVGRNESVTGPARLLHREFRRGEGAHTAALDGLTLTLLANLTRSGTPRPDSRPAFLDRVVEKLHDDLGSDAGLSFLAGIAGVSPEHLARTFREEVGCTVGEYVRRLRVERARRILEEDERPLASIALRLGFYDQSHFTRTFKAHVGCPPGEYRRRARDSGR